MEILCDSRDHLGESPIWDHRAHRLLWLDVKRGIVHAWKADEGAADLLTVPGTIGAIALMDAGDLLLATSAGLERWCSRSGRLTRLADPLQGRPLRFNDGRVDAAGRFWVGVMPTDPARYHEGAGTLLRYDPDGSVHVMESGLTVPNGPDWSPDGKTLYLADTVRQRIYAYDYAMETGTIGARRIFAEINSAGGYPDGLTVDQNGHLWCACIRGGVLLCFDASGRLLQKLRAPVPTVTALAFGGDDLRQAFVTSAILPADGDQSPPAGALFSIADLAPGLPATIFGARQPQRRSRVP